jgi:putative restriction endonuclease
MNRALDIKNWDDGGNNYILKGNPKNKWVGFQETVLTELSIKFGDNFNIVIWTDANDDNDYYCIPYLYIKHLFTEEHKTTGKYPNRWTAIILEHQFLMHSNSQLSVDIRSFHARQLLSTPLITVDEDFYIENAKAEINIRIGQSKFRNGVLKNFENRRALTEINEIELLTASHIIPWSHKKEFRGDISNGICLFVEYDALFDKGFFSLTDDLKIIIITNTENISTKLKERLNSIKGQKLRNPKNKEINPTYLKYHRTKIFKG